MAMRSTPVLIAALAAGAAMLAPGAQAHHSLGMFDFSQTLTLHGTVKEFGWANPHTFIFLTVTSKDGKAETWAVEGQSPNYLARHGWTRGAVKPGDRVMLTINPLKNGAAGGRFSSMVTANGQTLMQQPAD